jgi:hypothetical protein
VTKYATSEVARARRSQPTIRSVDIFHNDALSRRRPRSFTDVLSVRSPPLRTPPRHAPHQSGDAQYHLEYRRRGARKSRLGNEPSSLVDLLACRG